MGGNLQMMAGVNTRSLNAISAKTKEQVQARQGVARQGKGKVKP